MRRFLLASCLGAALAAQDPTPVPKKTETVPTKTRVVVTATRADDDPFELPYSTSTIDAGQLATGRQVRTVPETLRDLPGISVQKTAHGQGSPKFRGQTGFQTLLLVDGIRMNDSTWRSGNVEYWNQVDPYALDRIEIVRGPSSVLWGSDAVSGVGQAISKRRTSFEPGLHGGGALLFRYATAEDSATSHAESDGNLDGLGWHAGFSYKDYGDLRAGHDVGLLANTGYEAADGDVALTWQLSDVERLTFAAQHTTLRDVPRTHSTVNNNPWRGLTAGSDLQRDHTHRRWLTYARYEADGGPSATFDHVSATVAFKHRYEREDRIRSNGRRIFQQLDVQTPAVLAQAEKETRIGRLVFGVDWYRDYVDSEQREHAANGALLSNLNRGVVAGDAEYDLAGAFVEDTIDVTASTEVTAGLRYQYVNLSADDVAVPGVTAIDHLSDHWHAVTGSLRAIQRLGEHTRVFAGASQGFRAPNLSDTTRFDIGRTNEREIPSTDLDPEYYTTLEVGTRYQGETVEGSATAYYTWARDQIGRVRTGATNANGEFLVAKDNVGDGWYAGFELEGSLHLDGVCECLTDWSAFGWFDYVDARIDQVNSTGSPIHDRPSAIPPPSGRVGLRWAAPSSRAGFEAFAQMAYHVKPSRYTEADAQNTSRIPPQGLPGYAVVGLRGFFTVEPRTTVALAIENLGDIDYRIMDSGVNEPGVNAILTVETRF